jgi:hypothetical protein
MNNEDIKFQETIGNEIWNAWKKSPLRKGNQLNHAKVETFLKRVKVKQPTGEVK